MITFKTKHYDYFGKPSLHGTGLFKFKFPAGEMHLKDVALNDSRPHLVPTLQFAPSSLNDDLMALGLAGSLMSDYSDIIIPYFPAARADRGVPNGVEFYADFVSQVARPMADVFIFDIHSDLARETIKCAIPGAYFIEAADLIKAQLITKYDGIIAPDAGARRRAKLVADNMGVPLYEAEKSRDFETGKLTGYSFPHELNPEARYLVVDDICDGGGTFALLSQHSGLPKKALDLYVSHGVFSNQALEILPEHYNQVITTDSYFPTRDLPLQFAQLSIIHYIENIIEEKVN